MCLTPDNRLERSRGCGRIEVEEESDVYATVLSARIGGMSNQGVP